MSYEGSLSTATTVAATTPQQPAPSSPGTVDLRGARPAGSPREAGTPATTPAKPGPPKFRKDIEGMRALAVLAVVTYHAGVGVVSGGYVGVDVFFVISGFLITRQLLGELERTGRISIPKFYARRFRRLLPASVLVVLATLVASWTLLNPLRAKGVTSDGLWTLVYGLNWNLAFEGTDYLTATALPSPLQHYWSLAIEEQFYFVWPFLMVVASLALFRKSRRVSRTGLIAALSVLIVASLAASIWQTTKSQPWAYFGLHTRAWELALGAAVAVGAERLARHLGPWAARTLTWGGLSLVAYAIFAFDDSTVFPGSAVMVPVLGAGLILAGGCATIRGNADVLLRRPTLQFFGAMSYGWYLWHWPLLILAPAALGHELDLRHNLLVVTIGLGLAWLSYHLVEHPVRSMQWPSLQPWRGLGLGIAVSAAVAVVAVVVPAVLPSQNGGAEVAVAAELSPGQAAQQQVDDALARGLAATDAPSNLTPALERVGAKESLPVPQVDECHARFPATTPKLPCAYADTAGAQTIVLFGDSHALQWFDPLRKIAEARGDKLVSITKSACSPAWLTVWSEALRRPYTECDEWRAKAMADIVAMKPQLIVVSAYTGVQTHGMYGSDAEYDRLWAEGTGRTVTELRKSGAQVAVIGDTTIPKSSVPNCVADNMSDVGACTFSRAEGALTPGRRAGQEAAAAKAGAITIDPVPWLCRDGKCPVIVDNMLVYRDESHLSTVYSGWLSPVLKAALKL